MRTFAALAIVLLAALPAHAQVGKTRGVVEQYLIEKGILDSSGAYTGASVTINTTSPLTGGTTGTTFTLTLGTVPATKGGTGQTTVARGDLFYASAADTVSKLTIGSTGKFLGTDGTDVGWKALTGTANQVVVANTSGALQLSTPQDIGTGSSPQFLSLSLGGTDAGISRQGAAGILGILDPGSLTSSAALRVYNTTDAATGAPTNSEFIAMRWSSNVAIVEPSVTGTGTQRNLELRGNGTNNRIILYANNNIDFSSNGLFNFAGAQIILNSGAYFSYYYGTATAGMGVPAIFASAAGPDTDRTAAVDPVCSFVVGGSDQTFDVGGYVIVTDATLLSANLYCYYKDPSGTDQTMSMDFLKDAGSYGTLIAATGSYAFFKHTIRAKAGSTITLKTTGTFTTCHYKVDGHIIQLTK